MTAPPPEGRGLSRKKLMKAELLFEVQLDTRERVIWVLEALIPGQPVENLQHVIEGRKVAGSFDMQP